MDIEQRYAAIHKNYPKRLDELQKHFKQIIERRELLKNELIHAHKHEMQILHEELSKLEIGIKMSLVINNKRAAHPQEQPEDISSHDIESDSNLDPRCSSQVSPSEYDLCLCYYDANGADTSASIQTELQKMDIKTTLCPCPIDGLGKPDTIEKIRSVVYQSRFIGLVLTKDCLKIPSVLFACRAALYHRRRIILIHDQSSCPFPGNSEQPNFMVNALVFRDKAVTYLADFVKVCVENIHKKIRPKMELQLDDDYTTWFNTNKIRTRAFLSHKRSSAQGIAGRLYQALKGEYKLFLDSEADFDLHDLQLIVRETGLFIFILSAGIFESFWCLQELRSAIQNKKRIVFVRDEKYQLPNPLPTHIADFAYLFSESSGIPMLVYSVPTHTECVNQLKKHLGPHDGIMKSLRSPNNFFRFQKFDVSRLDTDEEEYTSLEFTPETAIDISIDDLLDAVEIYYGFPLNKINSFKILRMNCGETDSFKENGLDRLLKNCPHLHTLELQSCVQFTSASLRPIRDCQTTNLQHLALNNCKLVDDDFFASIADARFKLKSLELQQLPKITDKTISQIGKPGTPFDALHKLNLANLPSVTDAGFQQMASGTFHELESLTLYFLEITGASLTSLASISFPKLEKLKINDCQSVDATSLKTLLDKCFHLKFLLLFNIRNGEIGTALQNLKNMKNLEELIIWNVMADDTLYQAIAQSTVKKLQLVCHNGMQDQHAKIVFSNPACSFESIELKFNDLLTDDSLRYMAENPAIKKHLQHLSIHNPKITETGLMEVLKDSAITSLFGYLQSFTPQVFKAFHAIKTLQWGDVDDAALEVLAANNAVLENLSIHQLKLTKPESADHLTKFPNLQVLNIVAILQVPNHDDFLRRVCQGNLKNLKVLLSVSSVTEAVIEPLSTASFAGTIQRITLGSINMADSVPAKLLRSCPDLQQFSYNTNNQYVLENLVDFHEYGSAMTEEKAAKYREIKKWNKFSFDEQNKPFVDQIHELDDQIKFIQHSNDKELSQVKKQIINSKKILGLPMVEESSRLEILNVKAEPLGTYSGESIFDLCVLYTGNGGLGSWKELEPHLGPHTRVKTLNCPLYVNDTFSLGEAEEAISKSRVVLVIVTQDLLEAPSAHFALKCALVYLKRVLTAYCEADVKFPEVADQPPWMAESDIFGAQSLVVSFSFSEIAPAVLARLKPQRQAKKTRAYLCYQRNTGAPIAGRLYESLQQDYQVFIDVKSKYDLLELEQFITDTELVIVIISSNIFQSPWHIQEIRFALKHKKKILFVQDYQYSIPATLSPHLGDVQAALQHNPKVVYMPEFFGPFYERLIWELGAPDRVIQSLQHPKNSRLNDTISKWNSHANNDVTLTYFCESNSSTSLLEFLALLKAHFQVPLKSITNITIPPRSTIKANGIGKLLQECSSLHTLILAGRTNDDSFKNVEPGSAKEIKHLVLQEQAGDTVPILQQLAKADCVHMDTLEFNVVKFPDEVFSNFLKECRNLTCLMIDTNINLTGNGLQGLTSPQYTQLKCLKLVGCHGMTDIGLEYVAQGCPNLETFIISNAASVTDAGFHCLTGLKTLKVIHLQALKKVTTGAIASLLEASINLLEDFLASEMNLSDAVFVTLAKCSRLHTLVLSSVGGITQEAFITLAKGTCKLKKFRSGDLIDDTGLMELSKEVLKNATWLQLGYKITDKGLTPLFEGNKKYDFLDLSCTECTDQIINTIVSNKDIRIRDLSLGCKVKEGVSTLCLEGQHLSIENLRVSYPSTHFYRLESLINLVLDSANNTEAFNNNLADGLAQSNLKSLVLTYQCTLGDEFLIKLANSKVAQNLQELALKGNYITASFDALCNSFPNLKILDLDAPYMDDTYLKRLCTATFIRTLEKLYISKAQITADGVENLLKDADGLMVHRFFTCRQLPFPLQNEQKVFQEVSFTMKKM